MISVSIAEFPKLIRKLEHGQFATIWFLFFPSGMPPVPPCPVIKHLSRSNSNAMLRTSAFFLYSGFWLYTLAFLRIGKSPPKNNFLSTRKIICYGEFLKHQFCLGGKQNQIIQNFKFPEEIPTRIVATLLILAHGWSRRTMWVDAALSSMPTSHSSSTTDQWILSPFFPSYISQSFFTLHNPLCKQKQQPGKWMTEFSRSSTP